MNRKIDNSRPATRDSRVASPYKGLAPYDITDQDNFFGRKQEAQILIGKIFSYNITLLFAGTGVGKSSLLRAGVIPLLTQQHDLDVVYYADWVRNPIEGIGKAIQNTLVENEKISGREVKGCTDLHQMLEICTAYSSEPFVLILDQFEEVFQYHGRSERLKAGVEQLSLAVNDKTLPISIVLAMREDFLAELNIFKGEMPGLFDNYYRLERLRVRHAREAIEKPVERIGFRYEEGLVDHLLKDLVEREQEHQYGMSALRTTDYRQEQFIEPPYLQIVCNELWRADRENPKKLITTRRYETLGRAEQIVRKHFDQVMDKLSLRERVLAFEMFQYLVTSQGTKMAYRDEDLADDQLLGVPVEEIRPILQYLAERETRILRSDKRPDGTWYELYHDVFAQILRVWTEKFQKDENLRIYSQISASTRTWLNSDKDETFLLRGVRLEEAEEWISKNSRTNLSGVEQEFMDLSLKKHYRGVWLRRGIVVAIMIFAIISAALGFYANIQRREAEVQTQKAIDETQKAMRAKLEADEQREEAEKAEKKAVQAQYEAIHQRIQAEKNSDIARSRQLAAQANTLFRNNFDLALLLSVRASKIAETGEAQGALLTGLLQRPHFLKFLHGQTDSVLSLTFSPDGKMVAAGGQDATIRLWNIVTGQPLGETLTGHSDAVASVAFSPDGAMLVSGSWDATIRLWDVATGQPVGKPLEGHTEEVVTVAFSPDGTMLASGSWDNTVRLWDVATGQPIGEPFTNHYDDVMSVAFSPDGTRLASGSRDKNIILWDVATGQPLNESLAGHTEDVVAVAFSPDGMQLLSGSWDDTLRLWDVATGQPIGKPFEGHHDDIMTVAFHPNGKELVSGSWDKTIMFWELETGEPIETLSTGHAKNVMSIAVSPDGRHLVSGDEKSTIMVWDSALHEIIGVSFEKHEDEITNVAVSPDGTRLASGSRDKSIILWDAETGQPIGEPLTGHEEAVLSIAFSPDGRQLASGSEDTTIHLWDVETGKPVGEPLAGHEDDVTAVTFSPDGKHLASGGEDTTVRLWDVSAGELMEELLLEHADGVTTIAFSPDGSQIASGSRDGTLHLWDAGTGQAIGDSLVGHEDDVTAVVFSPGGALLASGSWDNTVRLWDSVTGESVGTPLTGHEEEVMSVAFSPDGTRLVSGSLDDTVRLWDMESGQTIGSPLRGHASSVHSVAFHPNGTALISGGEDAKLMIWQLDLELWQRQACRMANRNLEQQEWQQYFKNQLYPWICEELEIPSTIPRGKVEMVE